MPSETVIRGSTSGNYINLPNGFLDVFAQEVLFAAQPALYFESIAVKRTELMTTPGSVIKFLKYSPLSGSPTIAETAATTTKSLSTSTVSITVSEQIQSVRMSEMAIKTSILNIMGDTAQQLGRHYAKYGRDALIRNALLAGTNVLYSQKGGAATSRANLVTGSTFDLNLIRDAAETLATNKAPKFNGDAYVCFVHPAQGRDLRADAAWINVADYAAPSNMLNGEIGRIEDVRFVQTTMVTKIKINTQDIWADGEDTTDNTAIAANAATDVYQSIIVGDYAVGIADALPVEMRDNGVEDHGRFHSLAYYGIWGAGIIESGHSVILETA